MSGSPFGIGEYLSSKDQSDAVGEAADTAAGAQRHGIDVMYSMWEKAQEDLAPYLEAGGQGLASLTQNMPQYINDVLAPLAQSIAQYQASSPVAPGSGMVNPVTGEITPINQLQQTQQPMATVQQATQPSSSNQLMPLGKNPPTRTLDASGQQTLSTTGSTPTSNQLQYYNASPEPTEQNTTPPSETIGAEYNAAPTGYPDVAAPTYQPTTQNQLQLGSYAPGATTQQLQEGGVLSPLTPDLPGQIDLQWNPDDEVYQYKLKQAEDAQKRYLAAIGGTDSSPALTKMRDTGLAVAAEDIDKQYARQQTERNYLAQKMMDEYNAKAARGDTLYNRQQVAAGTGLGQYSNALSQYDSNRLNQLLQANDAYSNLYGLNYAQGLDLAKIGTGQAQASGQGSMTTGSNIANQYNQIGETQANAGLAQSAIWSNYLSGMQNQNSQVGNYMMNMFGNNTGGYGNTTTTPAYDYGDSYWNSYSSSNSTPGGYGWQ